MPSIHDMGVTNNNWGVCGFNSSLYALYQNDPSQRVRLGGATSYSRMLAEIKVFLRILQAEGEQQLLDDIETFTQHFGGNYANFTVVGYINRINNSTNLNHSNHDFSIALPPAAVVHYLQRVCRFPNARVVGLNHQATQYILGIAATSLPNQMYNGLAHYVYVRNGLIYSYGLAYASLATIMEGVGGTSGNDWGPCVKIVF